MPKKNFKIKQFRKMVGAFIFVCAMMKKIVQSRFSGSNSQKLERKITPKETKSQFFMLVWQSFFSLLPLHSSSWVKAKRKRESMEIHTYSVLSD
jgi:hypothetical protein